MIVLNRNSRILDLYMVKWELSFIQGLQFYQGDFCLKAHKTRIYLMGLMGYWRFHKMGRHFLHSEPFMSGRKEITQVAENYPFA